MRRDSSALLDAVVEAAARRAGHRLDGVGRDALAYHVARSPRAEALLEGAAADPAIAAELLDAALVRETCFYRNPTDFDAITRWVVPEVQAGSGPIRVWSAGCATGEEAYSLAACLLATLGPGGMERLDVLGTDLSESALRVAETGVYRPWAYRSGGPAPFPTWRPSPDGCLVVDPAVRAVTRFAQHNLLDGPPSSEGFDLVVCRNVLIYFVEAAAAVARRTLAASVRPGGFALFGALDAVGCPRDLVTVDASHPSLFARASAHPRLSTRPPTAPPPRASWRAGAPGREATHAIALHLQALEAIEEGDARLAGERLQRLLSSTPDYLPGVFELALLDLRRGDRRRAQIGMREVLQRASSLPAEGLVAGPQSLPLSYYRCAAEAFLNPDPARGEEADARRGAAQPRG